MGDACRETCQEAVAQHGNAAAVACWDPLQGDVNDGGRGSIVQRHTLVHLLLHLGVDVLAFDFDTFWFRSPRSRLEEVADRLGADILMTRHLDADCLNMGLIYIR